MRIVSLLPAATEWIFAFGAGDSLVGRSHACDFPQKAAGVPVVTRTLVPGAGSSRQVDAFVHARLQDNQGVIEVDIDRLLALEPDLILSQAQRGVCTLSKATLMEVLPEQAEEAPDVFAFEPYTLRQVLDTALHLARVVGCIDDAIEYLGSLEVRLRALRDRLGVHKRSDVRRFPSIACINWLDPLMTAGRWMPGVAEMAGGGAVLATSGERSRNIDWDDLRAVDPEVIAVMPCGFSIDRTMQEIVALTGREGWGALRAVHSGRVFVLDGTAYFNRPGPRLYRAIDLLASILHPDRVPMEVAPWEVRNLPEDYRSI